MTQADKAFTARISRIATGKQYEAEDVIGPRSMKGYLKAKRRGRFAEAPKVSVLTELFVTPFALSFGLLAVLAARIVWFQLASRDLIPNQFVDSAATGQLGLAIISAMMFVMAFHLSRWTRFSAVAGGFALMAFGEGAFAESAPWLWSAMFSPTYVNDVIQGATLASALL